MAEDASRKRPFSTCASSPDSPERRGVRCGVSFPGTPETERIYLKDCITFNGNGQAIEATPAGELGGNGGLTVVARVRRTKDCGPAWDRLIDFGNGAEKENIVINFQGEMMYEVRGEGGQNQALAVRDPEDAADPGTSETFPPNKWMHVSLVHGADGTASIYWNGQLKARGPVHLPQKVPRQKYYVGRSHWQDDPYFQGDIAELHVFDYALSDREVGMCAAQRSLPAGTRCRPIISLADSWREVESPLTMGPSCKRALMNSWPFGGGSISSFCGGRGCGGVGLCANVGGAIVGMQTQLHYNIALGHESEQRALRQLNVALEMHTQQVQRLRVMRDTCMRLGATREVQRLDATIASSMDAARRAQAVSRMIRYTTRLPTDTRTEMATGQKCSPPRISAAVDPCTGVYHAFAIYELRSGDVSHGARFHVYVTDLVNMRALMPFSTCWKENVGSLVISLLQRKASAEHEVVVLRALHDDFDLEAYYERIGFTSSATAFDEEGLSDSYRSGDMLYTSFDARSNANLIELVA